MNKDNNNMRYHKPYQELTFTDDFMFRKVLLNNQDLCKRLVELLLDVEADHIEYKDDNHSIETASDKKSVKLDVYLKDEDGTVFDLEMQNRRKDEMPKRTRFYQSMIDIEHLDSGAGYDELPDSYIVFICTFDPYESGLPKYEFRELCVESPDIELGAGIAKVFINAASRSKNVSDDMRAFLDYLCGETASSELTRDIESNILQAKERGQWRREYMTLEDSLKVERKAWLAEGRAEGLAEGLSEGEANRGYKDVEKLVASGLADEVRACEVLGVDISEYRDYVASKN